MSRRASPEEKVLEFFRNADPLVAQTVFNLAKSVMRERQPKQLQQRSGKRPGRPANAGKSAPEPSMTSSTGG